MRTRGLKTEVVRGRAPRLSALLLALALAPVVSNLPRVMRRTDGAAQHITVSAGGATPIRTLPNLLQVVIFETTTQTVATRFAPNAPQLAARLPDPLTAGNGDFSFFDEEYYDAFYSDANGTPNPDGSFLTIEGVWRLQNQPFGGMNINEVQLLYQDGTFDFADFVPSFVFGSFCNPGPDAPEQCIPGSQTRAVDQDTGTFPRFGHTSNTNLNERFRLTVGFNGVSAPPSQLQFSAASFSAGEAGGAARITVTRAGDASGAATVNFATTDGTAASGADYVATSGTLAFAAGETSKTFDVPVLDDVRDEADETVNLTLSNPGGATLGAPSTATLTISDDDPPPVISYVNDFVSMPEGNSGTTDFVFTVTLSGASGRLVTVNFAASDGAAPNNATAGEDYTAVSGTLTFNPGETSKQISVPVIGDTTFEPDEVFRVTLSNPTNATLLPFLSPALGSIRNDDAPLTTISISPEGTSVTEGDSGTTDVVFTVSLSPPVDQPVTVNVATTGGDATPGEDYVAVSGTLTFSPGETSRRVAVRVIGDRVDERDESTLIALSNPTPATATVGVGTASVRIRDDDASTLAVNDVRAAEGDSGVTDFVFTVTLSTPSSFTVTVTCETTDGTATVVGRDYAFVFQRLTFNPGETSKTITVPVNGDTSVEPDETFRVTLSAPFNAEIVDGSGEATIVNDDPAPTPTPTPSPTPTPAPTPSPAPTPTPLGRTFVLPHVLETEGRITNTTNAFDTQFFITYTGGGSQPPGREGATVELYLFDQTAGGPLRGLAGEVCNPCSFDVDGTTRKLSITVDDLISDPARGGGFDREVKLGFAVLVVSGADPDAVNLQGFVVNSHLNPFDLSVFGFSPEELPPTDAPQSPLSSEPATAGQASGLVRMDGRARDAGGRGLGGVNVALLSFGAAGARAATDTTGEGGKFSFTSLPAGDDHVLFPLSGVFLFGPHALRFDDLRDNRAADFTAAPTLGGRVSEQGGGAVSNATMLLTRNGAPHGIAPTDERGDYFFRGLSAEGVYKVFPLKVNFTFAPPARRFEGLPAALNTADFVAAQISAPSVVRFDSAVYEAGEADGFATVNVTRAGDTSGPAVVGYATQDGTASERSDYTKALGALRFAAGETSKSFTVLLNDDAHVEGPVPETLSLLLFNPAGGVLVGAGGAATLRIGDDDTGPAADDPAGLAARFVEAHYRDFLNRPPDPAGKEFWTGQITECERRPEAERAACREVRRVNVSAAFFLSIEFQETGLLVHRAHKAAFGDLPGKPAPLTLRDFLSGARQVGEGVQVGAGDWERRLEANKAAFFDEFVTRERFVEVYEGLSNAQYVEALNRNAGGALSPAERDALVAALEGGAMTRAGALRAVAEDADLARAERNRAFVLAQYFGYLRRNPDDIGFNGQPDPTFEGYNFWLQKLNRFNGNFIEAEMVKAFIQSIEYGDRFGL